jgi:hypothetical protein
MLDHGFGRCDGRHEKVDFGSAMMRKAAMLDLMQPLAAGRQFISFGHLSGQDGSRKDQVNAQTSAAPIPADRLES